MIAGHAQGGKDIRSCTILFPGLLGPDVPLQELPRRDWPPTARLPDLQRILQRGEVYRTPVYSHEHLVLNQLGISVAVDAELPVAALRASAMDLHEPNLWCLDPAYLELDREGATLTALDSLKLSAQESAQLIDSINRHFADTLRVWAHTPQHWLVQLPLQLQTYTPTQVLWRNLGEYLPSGPDAGKWRRLLNELQMLLHTHPVNQARMESGLRVVNSLWLWGGGTLQRGSADYQQVFADDPLAELASACNAVRYHPLPARLESHMLAEAHTLVVLTTHLTALMRKDVYAWFSALEQMEQAFLGPALATLEAGELDLISLISNQLQIRISRRQLRRWRLRKPGLAELVFGLRGSLDD